LIENLKFKDKELLDTIIENKIASIKENYAKFLKKKEERDAEALKNAQEQQDTEIEIPIKKAVEQPLAQSVNLLFMDIRILGSGSSQKISGKKSAQKVFIDSGVT